MYMLMIHNYTYVSDLVPGDAASLADAIRRLEMCIQEIRIKMWMTANKLKFNDGKTDFMVIVSAYYRQLITSMEIAIKVGNTNIHPTMSVENLGVALNTNITMHPHVNQNVRTAYFHLRSISRIRRLMYYDTCASVVQALVISRIDYANAVLIGLPENALRKLQLVQNSAARMITKTRLRDHVTPILKQLHWLPVHLRIVHKVLCLVFKAMTFATAPIYIKDMLELYRPARDLRSSSKGLQLTVPRSYRCAEDRAFSIAGPTRWNNLPPAVQGSKTFLTFKKVIKTMLFKHHYKQ